MKISIGIQAKNLKCSIELLTLLLADEMLLYVKTRNFHWNVTGDSFMELHKLFQTQYGELEETIDQIAERIGKLGGKAIGTMKEFLAKTRLKEIPSNYPNQKNMLKELANDYEKLIIVSRHDIEKSLSNKDAGTTDFLTGILEQNETALWILRRYLS
jgi:starvation-inducible DNA-binding protein